MEPREGGETRSSQKLIIVQNLRALSIPAAGGVLLWRGRLGFEHNAPRLVPRRWRSSHAGRAARREANGAHVELNNTHFMRSTNLFA